MTDWFALACEIVTPPAPSLDPRDLDRAVKTMTDEELAAMLARHEESKR